MITDIIKRDFIIKMQQISEQEFQFKHKAIIDNFSVNLSEIAASLMCELDLILNRYKQINSDGLVEELRYIYISYLRSSVLCGRPCYQIDFYDSRDRISEIECMGSWSFDYVFHGLYIIRDNLRKEFEKQTKAGIYELDYITLRLADRFHGITKELLPFVIEQCLLTEEHIFWGQCSVVFMLGEYLDKSEKIITWNAGRITNEMKLFKM